METSLLARLVVELLVSHMRNISTSIDGTVANGKNLYDTVQSRFAKEADGGKASKVLQVLKEDPKQRKNVEDELFFLLETDPAFVNIIRTTIQLGLPLKHPPQDDNESHARQRHEAILSTSYQQIKVEKRSTVENIRMSIKND